jgi:YVTN family beta-propeller protein
MNGQGLSTIAVLLLAAVALFFGAGCDRNPLSDIEDFLNPHHSGDPTVYFLKCEGNVLQAYRQLEDSNIVNPVDSPINGMDCSVSTELQGRELSLSQAANHGIAPIRGGSSHPGARPAASDNSVSLLDTFPDLVPLPFEPPVPKQAVNCNANLSSYLVNHTNGTVTDVGICPARVLKVIPVGSNPLQVALTPDGSTALVTRYDNAVVWINTSTDQVSFTLNTPNIYPSGIAISPDGTRAYVTNYFDINPSLLVIDLTKRAAIATVPLGRAFPRSLAITPDGSQVWVNYYNGTVVDIVDTLTLTPTNSLGFSGTASTGMAFDLTGTKAFIAVNPNSLVIVDTQTLRTIATLTVGATPMDVVLSQDGSIVYVSSYSSGVLSEVDAVNNSLIRNVTTNAGSMGLVVVPAGSK